ncbi:MAG: hypothetical protein SGBAC_012021 [Bacillariaceae sp.]
MPSDDSEFDNDVLSLLSYVVEEDAGKNNDTSEVKPQSRKSHANQDSLKHDHSSRNSTAGKRRHDEDKKVKERARRPPRAAKSPPRPPNSSRRGTTDQTAKDRASKDRARRSKSPLRGAESIGTNSSPSQNRSRNDVKRRTKKSEIPSKPGAESVGGNKQNRDRDSKTKGKSRKSKPAMNPGAESVSGETNKRARRENRKAGRQDPGAMAMSGSTKTSDKKSHKQQLFGREETNNAGGDVDITATAIAVDDDDNDRKIQARFNQIVQENETQRHQDIADGANGNGDITNEEAPKETRSVVSKRNICIVIVLLLAIGGGVAGYLLSQQSDSTVVELADADPTTDNEEDIPSGSPSTSLSLVPTTVFSTSPTTTYSGPSDEDCEALRNRQPIDSGDEQHVDRAFQVLMDVVLKDSKDSTTAMDELVGKLQSAIAPILIGCPQVSRRNLVRTMSSLHRSRRLLKQFAIADATFALGEDDTLTCVATDSQLPCFRPVIDLKILVKGNEKIFEIVGAISEALEANSGATALIDKLGLIDAGYVSILNMFIGDLNETDPPSSEPSRLPSGMPSSNPTDIASANPTFGPQTEPSSLPSIKPSTVPSQGPTNTPTVPATGTPTLAPVAGPTPPPSSAPSTIPSVHPSVMPSVMPSHVPSFLPSQIPSVVASEAPSAIPSISPSEGPTVPPSAMPSRTPSSVPSAVPSELPSMTPSMNPTMDLRPILMDVYNTAGANFGSTSAGWQGTGDWCTWDYVGCNSENDVTSLNIQNENLSGSISPRIGELTMLANLQLRKTG